MKAHRYVLCVGSNVMQEPAFAAAAAEVSALLAGVRQSSVYLSPDACRRPGVHDYLNLVISGKSPLPAEEFAGLCKTLEAKAGSRRPGEVPLDIDLVIADGCVLRHSDYAASHFRKGYDEIAE